MKRLKLRVQELNHAEILTRSQLKNVQGGIGHLAFCTSEVGGNCDVEFQKCCAPLVCVLTSGSIGHCQKSTTRA